MAGNRDQSVWNQYVGLSPIARGVSNFLDTLGLAANGATFGLGGGVVDALSGQDWGTTAHDARLRLNNSTNFNAGTAADVLGSATGAKAAWTLGGKAIGLARAAAPALGTRAAALGATQGSRIPLGQVARFALPGAAAIGIGTMARGGEEAAPVAQRTAPAPETVTSQPVRAAQPSDYITPRDKLSAFLDNVLSGPVSIRQAQAIGGLVEGTPKPQTLKNQVIGQTAQLSAQIFESQINGVQQQLASGAITEARAKDMVQKATEARFQRDAGLSGLNPVALAQAQMLNPDGEE